MAKALYPGTFDPVTNGHVDLIHRASRLFDEIVVAVAESRHKDAFFSLAERTRLLNACVAGVPNVRVTSFRGLLAEEFRKEKVDVVIRGLRAVSDFEYELMLALMNRKLDRRFETVFLMPSEQYIYLHSSLVREVFTLGGDVSKLVPAPVLAALTKRRPARRTRRGR
ncbi:MAG TPA: pantetheine-phosphate adenylyltransferase [Candidatus Krumholzibacteria bacterium]|nr:pantetheine-phosphate adenylyltransferase [Candidatus Krumholzibacteria bacterium]